jgi:hypothetical protein
MTVNDEVGRAREESMKYQSGNTRGQTVKG